MKRILPADVYDTLELAALAYGGVGQGSWTTVGVDGEVVPVCAHGLAEFADNTAFLDHSSPLRMALRLAGVTIEANDTTVRNWQARHKANSLTRMPWDEYCAALNIVRGNPGS